MFGVKKFHQYLLGRRLIVFSDHKPLQYLFSEDRPVPPVNQSESRVKPLPAAFWCVSPEPARGLNSCPKTSLSSPENQFGPVMPGG